MSTVTRPELSTKNPYWIEKHRYYELKHFCLQYRIWGKALRMLDGSSSYAHDILRFTPIVGDVQDTTGKIGVARAFYSARIDMVERAARDADPMLSIYILKAVTEGVSYDYLKTRLGIPCGKDYYYELYRRFFWLLNLERQ